MSSNRLRTVKNESVLSPEASGLFERLTPLSIGVRCDEIDRFGWFSAAEDLQRVADNLDKRISKQWNENQAMIDMAMGIASGWGTKLSTEAIRDFMLDEILKDFDPLGFKQMAREQEEIRLIEFLQDQILRALDEGHRRDLREMESDSMRVSEPGDDSGG